MKVFLATVVDEQWSRDLRVEVAAVARRDRFGVHTLIDDPRAADIVLFVDAHQRLDDWRMRALRRHPLVRARPDVTFVYDERDVPRDLLPGAYVAMPCSRFDGRRQRAAGYYRLKADTRNARGTTPDMLFSFQGRAVRGVRDTILALQHPRAVIEDTTHHDFFGADDAELDRAREHYREVIGRSKFILCPRGAGSASFRLFEALAAGRVPVVLSDAWVEPRGVDWVACSVRIREGDAVSIPARLEGLEARWPEMAAAAGAVYDEWFAPDVWFHRVIEDCAELLRTGTPGLSRQWPTLAYWRDAGRQLRATTIRWRSRAAAR